MNDRMNLNLAASSEVEMFHACTSDQVSVRCALCVCNVLSLPPYQATLKIFRTAREMKTQWPKVLPIGSTRRKTRIRRLFAGRRRGERRSVPREKQVVTQSRMVWLFHSRN